MSISVIMPVFNAAETLPVAIESILKQTYADFELIIIDDCSTDNSNKIIRSYLEKDSRIILYRNEKNLGVSKSLNRAVNLSKYELIARMDADDECLPERFELQKGYFDKKDDLALVGSYIYLMGKVKENDVLLKYPSGVEVTSKRMLADNSVCHPSVMYRKTVFNKVGGYRPFFKNAEDYDLWLRFLREGYLIDNVPLPLLRYKLSVGGATIAKRWEQYLFYRLAQKCLKYNLEPTDHEFGLVSEEYMYLKDKFIFQSFLSSLEQLIQLKQFKDAKIIATTIKEQCGVVKFVETIHVALKRRFIPAVKRRIDCFYTEI